MLGAHRATEGAHLAMHAFEVSTRRSARPVEFELPIAGKLHPPSRHISTHRQQGEGRVGQARVTDDAGDLTADVRARLPPQAVQQSAERGTQPAQQGTGSLTALSEPSPE